MSQAPLPNVLLCTATSGARQALRATAMALRLPPGELAPDALLTTRLQDALALGANSIALLDLDTVRPATGHLLRLASALPDRGQRARVVLLREGAGLWPGEQAWVQALGFAGLWGQLDAAALTRETASLVLRMSELLGRPALPAEALAQYLSAMQVKPDTTTPRGRIRVATGLSAEDLCAALAREVPTTDRSYRLTTYRACFLGSEAVDWLSARFRLARAGAVQAGLDLQALGLLQHVVHEQPFADLPNFYRTTLAPAVDACDLGAVFGAMTQPAGLDVQDRKYLGRTYPQCFVGAEAVTWIKQRLRLHRHEAEILLNRLLRFGLLEHVTGDHPVRDGNFFYRFVA